MAISDDDLDACFSTDDFGVVATFDINGDELEVNGHFTGATDAVMQYGVEIEAQDPSFTCRTSAIADVRNKMSVEIDSVTYTVQRITKIGNGVSLVYLKT